MKYVILSDASNVEPFVIPRQLYEINNETIIGRTIRLLKEKGVENIIVTSHDKRFDKLGAKRYEPKANKYKGEETNESKKGYWLNAFPKELLTEPITFLLGDVYYSDRAIKTIVYSETNNVMFFCSDKTKGYGVRYIKKHDEPFAFKVVDYELFKEHIDKLKDMFDKGLTRRHPIAWELYRSLNGIDVNRHELISNYIAINDITCDVDNVEDIKLIEDISNKVFIKLRAIQNFRDTVANKRRIGDKDEWIVDEARARYLLDFKHNGNNIVELIEIIR